VSVSWQEQQESGSYPCISADGRYVGFTSAHPNVVPEGTGAWEHIFIRDRLMDTTEHVSVDSAGVQANNYSQSPSISADGRYVAFESAASNLVSGDTNGSTDVFMHDRQSGTTVRVSVDSAGAQANNFSRMASISGDGRYVAFFSPATNLVSGDTNGAGDAFVHDCQTGVTERVSLGAGGIQADLGGALGAAYVPVSALSTDGRYVVFSSTSTNLVSGDTNGKSDVFLRDRLSGTTERVSLATGGAQANDSSSGGSLSPDGRYVSFESYASNLVSADTNATRDVFVHDRSNGTTERVSLGAGAAQGNDASMRATISADGRYVAFVSAATNLVSGDTNAAWDIFVHDRQTGSTERVSVDSAGVEGDEYSEPAMISADGRYVAFQSHATNLVHLDTNNTFDVFVRNFCHTPSSSGVFAGDGINADVITPENIVVGSMWGAPLTIGHPHGTFGLFVLKIRTNTINGANFPSPNGGRLTEVLISGPLLATFNGFHDGSTGNINLRLVPDDGALLGVPWAAQYTVLGGGFADLSQAVFGVIGCQ
jgi:Tol biopolymer transport system component